MQNRIETERLYLRPFTMDDAPNVAHLAGDKQIADMTANIPHPYTLKNALDWISTHEEALQNRASIVFAITLKDTGELIGAVSLEGISGDGVPSLGYWLCSLGKHIRSMSRARAFLTSAAVTEIQRVEITCECIRYLAT
jgi:RimJ/RimL family protein N-acetyltransferase